MIFDNRKLMNSFLTVKQGMVKLNCNNIKLKEKIENLIEKANANVDSNEWTNSDYLNFFRQLSKLDVKVFDDSYEEMLKLVELPLELLEIRLKDLNNKLELHLFDDERCMIPVEERKKVNDEEVVVKMQKLTFKPHEFSTADIVLFFHNLNSEINKHCAIGKNIHKNIIDKCQTLEEKEQQTKVLLDLVGEKDSDIYGIITKSYFEWISCLSKDDSIYLYLERKIPNLMQIMQQYLKDKLNEYDMQNEHFGYKKANISNIREYNAKEKQRLSDYRRHSIRF